MLYSPKQLRRCARYLDLLADHGGAGVADMPTFTGRGIRYPGGVAVLRTLARKLYSVKCRYFGCDKQFFTKNPKAKYCSPKCRNAAKRKGL